MAVDRNPRLGAYDFDSDAWRLVRALEPYLRNNAGEQARLAEGRIAASTSAATAAPTGGLWEAGDFVRNRAPAVAGTGGSQYVLLGWVCVASGEPGTWVDCRVLTGT